MINWIVELFIEVRGKGSWILKRILQTFLPENFSPGIVKRKGRRWSIESLRNNAAASIYWGLGYDVFTTKMIKDHVKVNDIVVDIGANIGIFTLLLSDIVEEGGKVFAIEASRIHSKNLEKNIQLQNKSNIVLIEKAVGNEKGTIEHFTTHSSGSLISGYTEFGMEVIEKKIVKIDVLINLLPSEKLDKIAFIKIDVDGNELDVLKGSKEVISKFRPKLLIEISERTFQKAGTSSLEVLKWIADLEYSFITKFTGEHPVDFETVAKEIDFSLVFFDTLCLPNTNAKFN